MWMYFSVPKSFFWSQGFASLCPWLYWIFFHRRVTRSEVTPFIFHMLSDRFEVCLNVDPIQVSFPFLGSSWRVLASNKMTHIHGMIARVFYLFQRTLNSRHVFVKITDISLRKSLIPEVFLDCYCVARKRLPWVPEDIFSLSILMVRGEAALTRRFFFLRWRGFSIDQKKISSGTQGRKRRENNETMRQTNICQVSTHLEIHFVLRSARKSCLFFLKKDDWLVQH